MAHRVQQLGVGSAAVTALEVAGDRLRLLEVQLTVEVGLHQPGHPAALRPQGGLDGTGHVVTPPR